MGRNKGDVSSMKGRKKCWHCGKFVKGGLHGLKAHIREEHTENPVEEDRLTQQEPEHYAPNYTVQQDPDSDSLKAEKRIEVLEYDNRSLKGVISRYKEIVADLGNTITELARLRDTSD